MTEVEMEAEKNDVNNLALSFVFQAEVAYTADFLRGSSKGSLSDYIKKSPGSEGRISCVYQGGGLSTQNSC